MQWAYVTAESPSLRNLPYYKGAAGKCAQPLPLGRHCLYSSGQETNALSALGADTISVFQGYLRYKLP